MAFYCKPKTAFVWKWHADVMHHRVWGLLLVLLATTVCGTNFMSPPYARCSPNAAQPKASNKLQTISYANLVTMAALMYNYNCLCVSQRNEVKMMQKML